MPQHRALLAAAVRWRAERVHFHDTAAQWSPLYRAPGWRLVLPASGAAQLRAAQGDEVLVDSLTAFQLESATSYQLQPEPMAGARSSVVVSASHAMALAPAQVTGQACAWLLAPRDLLRLRLHWRALERGHAGQAATPALLASVLGRSAPLPLLQDEPAMVARARRLLAATPGSMLSLQHLAEASGSSAFHLARRFRRRTGLSLHQYRLRLRLAAALACLEAGETDLAGLAHDLGFCSQSHFGSVFRRATGMSPAQARVALVTGAPPSARI